MRFFRVLLLCFLLGGDRGTKPASLEAFPLAYHGCDGRAHILFAPAYPVLLHPDQFAGTTVLSGILFMMTALLHHSLTLQSLVTFMKRKGKRKSVCTKMKGGILGETDGMKSEKRADSNFEVELRLKCPSGSIVPLTLKYPNSSFPSKVLFKEVENVTGIPAMLQMLNYEMHFLQPDIPLKKYCFKDGGQVNLSVKGIGGEESDEEPDYDVLDECVSCGEQAQIYCSICNSTRCKLCDEQWHKHPKRKHHHTKIIGQDKKTRDYNMDECDIANSQSLCDGQRHKHPKRKRHPDTQMIDHDKDYSMDEYDIANSPSLEESFHQATLIATLAERFNLTSFKPFQKEVIDASLAGRDTLVIYPTGSGKSLCFQFLPVYQNKKAIIVTPTISLMQDQVHKLNSLGIPSEFLGSAQLDKQVEMRVLQPNSKELLIFVTPEWVTKPINQAKMHCLVRANKLSLIAIDEAHLFTEWSDFRSAFGDLRKLKSDFQSTPIMALTATATPAVEDDIKLLLRNPVTKRTSINRPNITLNVEELTPNQSLNKATQFAKRAAEIMGSTSSIVYTDFVADIGPIVSALEEVNIEAVGYHGEMDAPSKQESFLKWKSGQVQTIVATKAFGMGIDKPDIRHIIRNGVPESLLSWAQELGRAGRDGHPACATILYRRSDISHANGWVLNNLSNKERCKRILSGFSDSWRYVNASLAGVCRRRILLDTFNEENTTLNSSVECCDVCRKNSTTEMEYNDYTEELKILLDALEQVGCKGEVKITEWIRGSKISWTDAFSKKCLSYGNHRGKDFNFWRTFIKQCHVMSLVQLELKSMIKSSGLYAVNGVYYSTHKGRETVNNQEQFLLPKLYSNSPRSKASENAASSSSGLSEDSDMKRKRVGKGSNILTIVRKLLAEPENWLTVESKKNYQFPGVFSKPSFQQLYYTSDASTLEQSCDNPQDHFIWKDIQLSKGQLNKDRLISVDISGSKEELYYRSAPCLGIKYCPHEGCNHMVPIRDKRKCPEHNVLLQKTSECPVEFVYIRPKCEKDTRRWFGGIVRCQKSPSLNIHNHKIHGSCKIAQCIKAKISDAIGANPALTPSEVACGKGLGFIPSAVDGASSHTGKVSHEIRKAKQMKGLIDKAWSPMNFEQVADTIDEEDNQLSGDAHERITKYRQYGRPYLVAAGYEDGIKFIFTMSPFMAKVATDADFIQCDITYDDCNAYPYIFNAVAFNRVSMEWTVIARLRLNKQSAESYALAFKKLFNKCTSTCQDFELGSTLLGVVTDWSDAEISGLKMAVGKEMAQSLLKGCRVHWQRSCQRVADRVVSSDDKQREKSLYLNIASQIPKLESSVSIVACFETLCGVRSVKQLLDKIPSLCSSDDAAFIDTHCDWSAAKHWAQWWARCDHLKMLSRAFSPMEDSAWVQCPSTTNAVERKNRDCKTDTPQCLKLAMVKVYKIDKVACLKHISAEDGVSLSYRSRSEEARREAALKKRKQRMNARTAPDKNAQFGPPDRSSNFVSRKRARSESPEPSLGKRSVRINVDSSKIGFIPNSHPEILGKRARMKFESPTGQEEWYDGIICSYNGITGKYGIYFPCDDQTEEASFDDEDMEIID